MAVISATLCDAHDARSLRGRSLYEYLYSPLHIEVHLPDHAKRIGWHQYHAIRTLCELTMDAPELLDNRYVLPGRMSTIFAIDPVPTAMTSDKGS